MHITRTKKTALAGWIVVWLRLSQYDTNAYLVRVINSIIECYPKCTRGPKNLGYSRVCLNTKFDKLLETTSVAVVGIQHCAVGSMLVEEETRWLYTIRSFSIFVIVLRQREVKEDYFSYSEYSGHVQRTRCERDFFIDFGANCIGKHMSL